jgi:hypothetical protein
MANGGKIGAHGTRWPVGMSRGKRVAFVVIAVATAGGATAAILALRESGGGAAKPKPASTGELVERLLTSPVPSIRQDAARRLGARLDPTLTRRVVTSAATAPRGRLAVGLLRNRYLVILRRSPTRPATRIKAIRSLAVFDDPAAANAVATALIGDRNAAVRRAAKAALVRMKRSLQSVLGRLVIARDGSLRPRPEIDDVLVVAGAPAVKRLIPLLPSSWAEDVISRIGPPALPLLRGELANGGFHQKCAAAYGLLAVGKRRPAAVRADIDRIVAAMMTRLGTVSADFDAVEVLAHVGKPALDVLLPLARKSYLEVQGVERKQWGSAEFALVRMARLNPRATAGLIAALDGHDYDLIADLHNFYIQLGRAGSEPALIAALDARGDAVMALDFLNSGNAKLDRGARDWAARNGYTITTAPGQGPPPSWGTG